MSALNCAYPPPLPSLQWADISCSKTDDKQLIANLRKIRRSLPYLRHLCMSYVRIDRLIPAIAEFVGLTKLELVSVSHFAEKTGTSLLRGLPALCELRRSGFFAISSLEWICHPRLMTLSIWCSPVDERAKDAVFIPAGCEAS